MKYLIIDDLVNKGWKSVIEKVIIRNDNILDSAMTFDEAMLKLNSKYELVFLDIRLTEEDHSKHYIKSYSGHKIISRLRSNFHEVNYCTPIILITASNKIWNINAFMEQGADGFYIKEHPDFNYEIEWSRENLENFQSRFIELLDVGQKRREIWTLCRDIINLVSADKHLKSDNRRFVNIRGRISDKLKLGYSELFQARSSSVKKSLISSNESISFIIFWSVLEEISKGFSCPNETWQLDSKRATNWKFNNGEYFIKYSDSQLTLNFKRKLGGVEQGAFTYEVDTAEYNKYLPDSIISLSDQIYALLAAYCNTEIDFNSKSKIFYSLNKYRNEMDFTHGSVNGIFSQPIINDAKADEAFDKNLEVLTFIRSILSLP
jgi:CheY-like chemotaxis protein